MLNIWELQKAKKKLSEVVRLAEQGQPQVVNKNGQPFAVVIPIDEYKKYLEWQEGRITLNSQ